MDEQVERVLAGCAPGVRELAVAARAVIEEVVPDAVVEVDPAARLIAYTFQPGTYRGVVAAIALHGAYVNLMFGRGVELVALDDEGLLEGTGRTARHIKVRRVEDVARAGVRRLIAASAALTPRSA
ncbi:DUF1801 domain-containing protein [Nonomuraea sp. NPDC005650]|uniref:DUF1801 domain-containing protein n=1 Tax=Nonomuraea sp. NPDC005650 TaxID=3157045 RepID=UPI0033A904D1